MVLCELDLWWRIAFRRYGWAYVYWLGGLEDADLSTNSAWSNCYKTGISS